MAVRGVVRHLYRSLLVAVQQIPGHSTNRLLQHRLLKHSVPLSFILGHQQPQETVRSTFRKYLKVDEEDKVLKLVDEGYEILRALNTLHNHHSLNSASEELFSDEEEEHDAEDYYSEEESNHSQTISHHQHLKLLTQLCAEHQIPCIQKPVHTIESARQELQHRLQTLNSQAFHSFQIDSRELQPIIICAEKLLNDFIAPLELKYDDYAKLANICAREEKSTLLSLVLDEAFRVVYKDLFDEAILLPAMQLFLLNADYRSAIKCIGYSSWASSSGVQSRSESVSLAILAMMSQIFSLNGLPQLAFDCIELAESRFNTTLTNSTFIAYSFGFFKRQVDASDMEEAEIAIDVSRLLEVLKRFNIRVDADFCSGILEFGEISIIAYVNEMMEQCELDQENPRYTDIVEKLMETGYHMSLSTKFV